MEHTHPAFPAPSYLEISQALSAKLGASSSASPSIVFPLSCRAAPRFVPLHPVVPAHYCPHPKTIDAFPYRIVNLSDPISITPAHVTPHLSTPLPLPLSPTSYLSACSPTAGRFSAYCLPLTPPAGPPNPPPPLHPRLHVLHPKTPPPLGPVPPSPCATRFPHSLVFPKSQVFVDTVLSPRYRPPKAVAPPLPAQASPTPLHLTVPHPPHADVHRCSYTPSIILPLYFPGPTPPPGPRRTPVHTSAPPRPVIPWTTIFPAAPLESRIPVVLPQIAGLKGQKA